MIFKTLPHISHLCFLKIHKFFIRDEVRISELSEIRSYSDHFGDRKSMPQIRILEYTIFRAFFCDFHHFPLHFPHHFPHYVPQQYFLHFWQLFCTIKRVQKSKKDNSQRKDENDEENEEENDENLWSTEASKLRSFEAFVTEIEISIFGFENSTLPISMNFTLNLQK